MNFVYNNQRRQRPEETLSTINTRAKQRVVLRGVGVVA